jgi:DNA-binding phage protein
MTSEVAKLTARVRKFVKQRQRVKFRLALRAGLSENALKDCDKPNWNPRIETLDKVVAAIEEMEAEERKSQRFPKNRVSVAA